MQNVLAIRQAIAQLFVARVRDPQRLDSRPVKI